MASMTAGVATACTPGKRSRIAPSPNQWSPCPWVMYTVVRFFPVVETQSATAMPCSTVMRGSTKTASCRPEMRVADIGLQVERLWPGGASPPAIAMIGATKTW
jgi:hypothetical protein